MRVLSRTLSPRSKQRVKCLAGHFVHVPQLIRAARDFYSISHPEERAVQLQKGRFGGPSWLAVLLMIMCIGLCHSPSSQEASFVILDNSVKPNSVSQWVSAAGVCLEVDSFVDRARLSTVQALLLMVALVSTGGVQPFDEGIRIMPASLLRLAISHAMELGLHRLGGKKTLQSMSLLDLEIGKRVWWALVFKEWDYCSLSVDRVPVVRLQDFNTPIPKN